MNNELILNATGAGADDVGLLEELRVAVSGDVQPVPIAGGLADVWRLAVEWGPQAAIWLPVATSGFQALKAALEVIDKLLALRRSRPGLTLTIPSRDGPVVVTEASREQAAALVAARLEQLDSSK